MRIFRPEQLISSPFVKGRLSGILVPFVVALAILPLLSISCKPEPPEIPKPETPIPVISPQPAYTLDINWATLIPSQPGLVKVVRGSSTLVLVTVRSLVDKPINIRLKLAPPVEGDMKIPEFAGYEVPPGYLTLNAGDKIRTQMLIKVSENAPIGNYSLGITGELEKPVEGRSGVAMMFTLEVIGPQPPPLPPKMPTPAYDLDIKFPSQIRLDGGHIDQAIVKRGSALTLPVTIRSRTKESINIRLALFSSVGEVPEFVKYEVPPGYLTLDAGDNISTQILIKVSGDAPVGNHSIGIWGELEKPVIGRSTMGRGFTLTVTRR